MARVAPGVPVRPHDTLLAVAFTPRTQAVFFVLSVASYSAALGASRWNPVNLAVLGVLAFLANLLVGQLKSQTVAHRRHAWSLSVGGRFWLWSRQPHET